MNYVEEVYQKEVSEIEWFNMQIKIILIIVVIFVFQR